MKNNILFINACLRENSRTAELAQYLLDTLDGEISEVCLYQEHILPLDKAGLAKRENHDYSGLEYRFAKQFANADTIVIAAPFWDLSFPSVLKIYLENITVSGITFEYSEEGRPVGKCKAKKLYYITTAGGYIGENNFGFDYIEALARNFYGIDDVHCYAAEGLDILGADVKSIMDRAKELIIRML